jgi:hypothetical protein
VIYDWIYQRRDECRMLKQAGTKSEDDNVLSWMDEIEKKKIILQTGRMGRA